mmetsp:Transcript_26940/g.67089  ORF Transcript_26940/g.67089 Transcript_26940/m.67089 type:complete len:225 (+) Transcript_26940:1051-1725(+)
MNGMRFSMALYCEPSAHLPAALMMGGRSTPAPKHPSLLKVCVMIWSPSCLLRNRLMRGVSSCSSSMQLTLSILATSLTIVTNLPTRTCLPCLWVSDSNLYCSSTSIISSTFLLIAVWSFLIFSVIWTDCCSLAKRKSSSASRWLLTKGPKYTRNHLQKVRTFQSVPLETYGSTFSISLISTRRASWPNSINTSDQSSAFLMTWLVMLGLGCLPALARPIWAMAC